ncbi:MAG TPA: ABC transporter [Nitrospirales bacterium]|nr:ABC transporter [Nitrospirales bacterium]
MTFVHRTLCIAKREFRSYFNSPIAYIVISVFLLLSGWFFFSSLFLIGRSTLRGFFSFTPILFIMFIPAITMRLIAEEVKTGTLEWLTSMPLRDLDVVLGKFLAALGLIAVALAMTLPYPISVDMVGALDWGPVIGGYIGLLLLAGAFLAVGLFASSLTENQIVAFIIGVSLCFTFFMLDKVTFFLPEQLGAIFQYLSVDYHFRNIARGVIDTRDLLFYLGMMVIGLFLTMESLKRRHA